MKEVTNNKKICLRFVIFFSVMLVGISLLVFIEDPWVHYRYPNSNYVYTTQNAETYSNIGLAEHLNYEGIIVGSSQTYNFKCEKAEKLFGSNFIRLSNSGATYKESDLITRKALSTHSNIKRVIRPIDETQLIQPKDKYGSGSYPLYIYDDSQWNDIQYLLNINVILILFEVEKNRIRGNIEGPVLDFDNFEFEGNGDLKWGHRYDNDEYKELTEEDIIIINENIEQNIIETVSKYPNVEFDFFFPPYSIIWFDELKEKGLLKQQLDAQFYVIDRLVGYENIHLYSYYLVPGLIDEFDNYYDYGHYCSDVSNEILEWICEDRYRITEDNKEQYKKDMIDFIMDYDFDARYERYLLENKE